MIFLRKIVLLFCSLVFYSNANASESIPVDSKSDLKQNIISALREADTSWLKNFPVDGVQSLLNCEDLDWIRDQEGNSLLHRAAGVGNLIFVELLLKLTSDPDIKNEYGQTPIDLALSGGHDHVVSSLQAAGVKIKSDGSQGFSSNNLMEHGSNTIGNLKNQLSKLTNGLGNRATGAVVISASLAKHVDWELAADIFVDFINWKRCSCN